MLIEPAALVVLPITGLAALRQRWSFLLLLVSVPFFTLEVATFASHPFTFPEIAMILFIAHQVRIWIREGRMRLPNGAPVILLWIFAGLAALSVMTLAIRGSTALVHPYEAPFLYRSIVPLNISGNNLSQLFLRVFFVASVTAIAVYLDWEQLKVAVRGLVYGAVLTVLVGLSYQLAVVAGWMSPIDLLSEFGFRRFGMSPGSLGPVPRMYSLPGEPGFTADHVLYAFTLVVALTVIRGRDWAFQRWERLVIVPVLGVGLLASTATTGYGGLLVFVAVLAGLFALAPWTRPPGFRHYLAISVVVVTIITAALAVTLGPTLFDMAKLQVQKMTFQARSGSIRLFYIQTSFDIFRHHPIIGSGVGSHAAPSYLFTLLAETGIVGTITLALAHILPYRQCVGLFNSASSAVRRGVAAVVVAGFTLFLTNLIAKSISSLMMPWYWFGIAIPIAVVARNTGHEESMVETTEEIDRYPGGKSL